MDAVCGWKRDRNRTTCRCACRGASGKRQLYDKTLLHNAWTEGGSRHQSGGSYIVSYQCMCKNRNKQKERIA